MGTLAIAGIIALAGYFSKDAILAGALGKYGTVFFAIGLADRAAHRVLHGAVAVPDLSSASTGARETASTSTSRRWSMLGPLVILAVGSAVGGFVDIPIRPARLPRRRAPRHPGWLPFVAT